MHFLYINSADKNNSFVALLNADGLVKKLDINNSIGLNEQLLFLIDSLLISSDLSVEHIKVVAVNNSGGTFSSLRGAIVTANSLAYSLKIPIVAVDKNQSLADVIKKCLLQVNSEFQAVFPVYDREPNITTPKASE